MKLLVSWNELSFSSNIILWTQVEYALGMVTGLREIV